MDKLINLFEADKMLSKLSGMYHIEDIRAMLLKLPTFQPAPQWISVKDRLPDDNHEDWVIVCVNGKKSNVTYENAIMSAEIDGGRFWDYECSDPIDITTIVTHWMPFPEPPEVSV